MHTLENIVGDLRNAVVFYDPQFDEIYIVDVKTMHPWSTKTKCLAKMKYTQFNGEFFSWSSGHSKWVRLGKL